MNIAVDNDELLFDFVGSFIVFHNEVYGTKLTRESFFSYRYYEVLGIKEGEDRPRFAEFYQSEYFENIQPVEGAQKAMKHLKESGHTLFVVTGRIHSLVNKTMDDLTKYYPDIFSGISFANTYGTNGDKRKKSTLCRQLNSRIILEDDFLHIYDCANAGIFVLVPNHPWNQGVLPDRATRFFNWKEAINSIANMAKEVIY